MTTYRERVLGAVMGQAIGDALGVPVEFTSRESRQADPVVDMRGYGTHDQPPGTWSDDTSLMLCLLQTLVDGFNLNTLAGKFIAWEENGYWTPYDYAFDIGHTTYQAITNLKAGVPPLEAGGDHERSNGNGSLMRILPVGFLTHLKDEELARTAEQVSCLTHRHLRSQMACGIFVLLCRRLLGGLSPQAAYKETGKLVGEIYQAAKYQPELVHFQRFFNGELPGLAERDIQSSGYVVHTLEASVWCLLTSGDFAETVLKAVNLGQDTDTTAAVAGGLAGLFYGIKGIPDKWQDKLARGADILELINRFLEKYEP